MICLFKLDHGVDGAVVGVHARGGGGADVGVHARVGGGGGGGDGAVVGVLAPNE